MRYNDHMTIISIDDIQSDLLAYLEQVEQAGETLLITRSGKPVAEIRPVAAGARSPRPFGLCAGQFAVPDDFDDPLPEEVLREFEGQ
jgi:antitoxin (DNA-binding transcriptional repressor) of toxin-antitoxin stability system